jgi:hypothetical protein
VGHPGLIAITHLVANDGLDAAGAVALLQLAPLDVAGDLRAVIGLDYLVPVPRSTADAMVNVLVDPLSYPQMVIVVRPHRATVRIPANSRVRHSWTGLAGGLVV